MRNTLRGIALAMTGAFVVLLTQAAIGVTPATLSGKSVSAVKIVRSDVLESFTDDSAPAWTAISGAQTSIKVPATTQAILLVRFSGSSSCWGGGTDESVACYVRVIVNGVEAAPAWAGAGAFDSNNGNRRVPYAFYSLAIDRSAGPFTSGTYVVKAQAYVTQAYGGPAQFDLANYTMVVERIKV